MELKKSPSVNTENLRVPILLMGLMFVSGILLASFTYTTIQVREQKMAVVKKSGDHTVEEEPEDQPEPPQQEEQQMEVEPPPSEDIQEKEDEAVPPPPAAPPAGPPPAPPGDNKPLPKPPVVDFPDVEATFPGGAAAMQQWINDNVQYPQTSIEMNEQGRVYLSFVVETDGSITNIKVERGVSTDLDREAKRVVRKMPHWVPGEAAGEKARTRCRLPIIFTLE